MKTKHSNILLVTSEFPPQPGGIGNHAFHLAKHLEQNDFNVEVIADQRSVVGEEEKEFDTILKFKVYRIALRKLRLLMYIKRIRVLFKRIKTSNVVIASGKFSLWSVAFASIFYKRSYYAVIHGSEVNFTKPWLKLSITLSLKRFSTLIAVSNFTKELVNHIYPNVVVIPNGIDVEKLKNVSVKKKEIIGTPKLITVGNVTYRKGQLNVIKQLPELLKKYPNLHYHCLGLPTQKDEFLKIANSLKVIEHISFHGRVSNEELFSFLKSSDIFVMLSSPARTGDVEGFGIALLEANFFGIPTIGSNGCGIEDAIKDKVSGRLIQYDDTSALLTAVQAILSDYNSFKTDAKTWAREHSWQFIIKRYIKALDL